MARIVIQPSGKVVECKGNDTVLMALEQAGYALPNNCRAGACGECKVRVLSGQYDQGMVLDMALTEEERRAGCGLMCMAKPISDEMEIEWGDAEARPKLFPPREGVLFVIVDRRELAARVLELTLRPVGKPIRYWPGQYVTLGDEREGISRRAYSISNAPRPDGELVLQIAQVEDGITSRWVHETLKIGDSIKVNGAYGTFIGDPSAETPVLCLAAGTGLAPILDLAEAAMRRGYNKRVDLIFSARTAEDVYGMGLMAWWRAKHRKFDYKITLTREKREGYLHGRIDSLLPELYPDLSEHSLFIAGSPEFVNACEASAKALGAQDSMIHKEGFFQQQAIVEGR
ncbi:MAG: 2Fe-2S iron-sulfur cluster binding domain-containing protein [Alteromonadaceae bacterium]|nr:2Fe-2S iron-sulfur cluster binding domain-containing protein [Alteromonadaceae bacterium]